MASASRQEVINVGLVIFRKQGIDVRILESSAKIRLIDGASDQDDLNVLKKQYEELCALSSTAEEQFEILSLFKGRTYISGLAEFVIDENSQYESKVARLFNKLVKPYAFKKAKVSNTRFATTLKNKFKALDLLAQDPSELSQHKIVHNYPISENSGISADFLLKNGKFHLTETIDYNLNDASAKFKETSFKLMTFMEGKNVLDGDVNNYFVYKATPQREAEVFQQINLAENYSDRIFNFESQEDTSSYFQIISEAIGRELPLIH